MANIRTVRKSQPDLNPIVSHINQWERAAIEERDKKMGEDWFTKVETLYSIRDVGDSGLAFRPSVSIPQLQTLMLYEANDLSETSPRIYIVKNPEAIREDEREKVFQAQWKQSNVNYHILFANLWALFSGLGLIQLGYDPDANAGRGNVWVKSRNPKTFFPDPTTDSDLEWSFIILHDWMEVEEVRRRWPFTSLGIRPSTTGNQSPKSLIGGSSDRVLEMPSGPMQTVPVLPMRSSVNSDSRVLVRTVFLKDYTREVVEEGDLEPGAMVQPEFRWKYPNGRLIVESEGLILQDGENPYPRQMFPIVPFWSMPPLFGIWGVPATRLSLGLQGLAEKFYTQTYENAFRLSNGVWFIDEKTGIDLDDFGGIPGEVKMKNANSPTPEMVFPTALPSHMVDLPQRLLDMQKELQGATSTRQGNPGAGNISAELFDESVLRSQGMTQLRGRLGAMSVQRLAYLMFYTMMKFYKEQKFPVMQDKNLEFARWAEPQSIDAFEMHLDDSSLEPLSQAAIRRMAPDLVRAGIIGGKHVLKALGFPNAEEISQEREKELQLQALSRQTKGGRR